MSRPKPGPTEWLDRLDVGGPYVLPKHIAYNVAHATTGRRRFAGKRFRFKTQADGSIHVWRLDLAEALKAEADRRRRGRSTDPDGGELITPSDWLDTLPVGGPYDIPRHLCAKSLRAVAMKPRFKGRKQFQIRKPSTFKPEQVSRVDDGAEPTYPWEPSMGKKRQRRQSIDERIMALMIGEMLDLDINEYGVRGRAAIVTRNTGRQFTIEERGGAKRLVRRG